MSNSGPNDKKRQREIELQKPIEFGAGHSLFTYFLGVPFRNDTTTALHEKVRTATALEIQTDFFSPHRIDSLFSFFNNSRSAEGMRKSRIKLFINEKDAKGNTALHIAALLGKAETATILVLNDADTKILNSEGKTAAEVAHEQGHIAMAFSLGFVATTDVIVSSVTNTLSGFFNSLFESPASDTSLSAPSSDGNSAKKPRLH